MVTPVPNSPSGSRALTGVAGLAVLLAAALLAIVVAWWGWRAFGPATVAFVPAAVQEPALALLASGLFAAPASTPGTPDTPARAIGGDVRLLGVLAEDEGRGFALFRTPSRTEACCGRKPGRRRRVPRFRSARRRHSAGRQRRTSPAASRRRCAGRVAKTAPRAAACTAPSGFKGDTLRLNAELVGGIIAQPDAWAALAAPDQGALTVRDDSGFSAMLAMKKGDRIELANGIALRAPDDIVTAVLRPLTAGQAVRLVGSRGGLKREWLLLNAGTCP